MEDFEKWCVNTTELIQNYDECNKVKSYYFDYINRAKEIEKYISEGHIFKAGIMFEKLMYDIRANFSIPPGEFKCNFMKSLRSEFFTAS